MEYEAPDKVLEKLRKSFSYHPPKGDQTERFVKLREKALELAEMVVQTCPHSREASMSLRRIEESVMWATSAISQHEDHPS